MIEALDPVAETRAVIEEWRPVPGYPAYEVSDDGHVRRRLAKGRWAAGHVLSPGRAHSGHLYVVLTDETGHTRKQFVHRVVAAAFIGPAPFEGAMVLHHDDDATHNRPSNLYWGDRAENARDAKLNRKRPSEVSQRGAQSGEANSSAVLTEANVLAVRRYLDLGLCGACIARMFGVRKVRKETIYSIAKGRTWTHIERGSA